MSHGMRWLLQSKLDKDKAILQTAPSPCEAKFTWGKYVYCHCGKLKVDFLIANKLAKKIENGRIIISPHPTKNGECVGGTFNTTNSTQPSKRKKE